MVCSLPNWTLYLVGGKNRARLLVQQENFVVETPAADIASGNPRSSGRVRRRRPEATFCKADIVSTAAGDMSVGVSRSGKTLLFFDHVAPCR